MQSFSNLAYLFLTNDLNVVFSIFLAAGMLCRTLQKKNGVIWRMILLALLGFGWSLLTNQILYLVSWPDDPFEVVSAAAVAIMIVKYLTYFALTFGGIWFCVRCSGYTLLYCATLSYCMEHLGEKTWEFVEAYFEELPVLVQMLFKYGCILLVFALIWIIVLRRYPCEDNDLMQTNRTVLLVAFIVVILDIVLSAFSTSVFISGSNASFKLVDNAYSMLANLLVLFSATNLLRVAASQQELETVRQVQQAREEQYRRDQKTQDVLNVKCHDLKYQLSLLEEKMEAGELDQIRQVVDDYDTSIQTGQPALDVVLANKRLVCNGRQITLTAQVDGKALDFMSEVDIYTMFGNILDNAIEAVEYLPDARMRIICLTIQNKNGFLFIHEENYYQGEVTLENGRPLTRKDDKDYHGFGTRSIQMIAEKYQGQMEIHASDGVYTLDIVLPGGQA